MLLEIGAEMVSDLNRSRERERESDVRERKGFMRFLEFNPRREKKKKKRGLIFIFVGWPNGPMAWLDKKKKNSISIPFFLMTLLFHIIF